MSDVHIDRAVYITNIAKRPGKRRLPTSVEVRSSCHGPNWTIKVKGAPVSPKMGSYGFLPLILVEFYFLQLITYCDLYRLIRAKSVSKMFS